MSTLLSQMTDICVFLYELSAENRIGDKIRPEIHIPKEMFDRLLQQMYLTPMVGTQNTIPKDEMRINGIIIKRKQ